MDVKRLRVGRFARCPRCRHSFTSLRLSHYVCPACTHTWDVEHPRSTTEKITDAIGGAFGHVVIGTLWLMLLALTIGALVVCYVLVDFISNGLGLVGVIIGVAVVLAMIAGFARVGSYAGGYSYGAYPAERYMLLKRFRRNRGQD